MAEVKARRYGLKTWIAVYEGATICYHGKGSTKEAALGALWLAVFEDRESIEKETLVTWLDDVYEAHNEGGAASTDELLA